MITILIALAAGVAVGLLSGMGLGAGWGIFIGIVVALAVAAVMIRMYIPKLKAVTELVQNRIMEGQEEAQRLLTRYQNRPVGTPQMMQQKIEKVVADHVREALVLSEQAAPLYPWIPLANKQVATLRFTLNYQIKDFEAADACMPNILALEPTVLAMKLVRLYKNHDKSLDKTFRKGVGRYKYEKGKLIWATYIWILIKSERMDEAVTLLAEAKEKIEDEAFARNWELAVNGHASRISFASLGNEWFAMHLEAPKQPKQGKGDIKNHPLAQKGRKRFA